MVPSGPLKRASRCAMDVLILGGTGVISVGIVHQLLARGASVTIFNRGRVSARLPDQVRQLRGDRTDRAAFERVFEHSRYDVVIDMICFTPEDAGSTARAFGGRCAQLQLCSTVCTYSTQVPPQVLVDEAWPQEPETRYGRDKVACERVLAQAAAQRKFALTIVRPSQTYGPGGPMLDQLEIDGVAWDRVARGLPILCAGDGLGLWQALHRDDCGKLFAWAALNPRTYGEAYNATGPRVLTWRDYHREVAAALGARARLVFAPAGWLLQRQPARFGFLRDVSRFHGAYSSAKARAHVPEFMATVGLEEGARATIAALRQRGGQRDGATDLEYQRLVDAALLAGFPMEHA